jgi:hypothetical protein
LEVKFLNPEKLRTCEEADAILFPVALAAVLMLEKMSFSLFAEHPFIASLEMSWGSAQHVDNF